MLVLDRREGQQVVIDNGRIFVKVLGVVGTNVRLAFLADRDVDIDREERFDEKIAGYRSSKGV